MIALVREFHLKYGQAIADAPHVSDDRLNLLRLDLVAGRAYGGQVNKTCAICVGDIVGEPRREPLGRGDAMVNVCSDCATLDARHYSFDDSAHCRGQTPNGNRRIAAKGPMAR